MKQIMDTPLVLRYLSLYALLFIIIAVTVPKASAQTETPLTLDSPTTQITKNISLESDQSCAPYKSCPEYKKYGSGSLVFISNSNGQRHSDQSGDEPWYKLPVYVGIFGSVLIFLLGNVLVPGGKYLFEVRTNQKALLSMIRATVDQTVKSFGTDPSNIENSTIIKQLDKQIEQAEQNSAYQAMVAVSDEDTTHKEIMGDRHFWLLEPEVIESYIEFSEAGRNVAFTCETLMSEEFVTKTTDNRSRYINALRTLRSHYLEWLKTALATQEKVDR